MKKFDHVEDYLLVIAGYLDVVTGKLISSFYFGIDPIVNLARYDVSVLESMTDAVLRNVALTEKQGDLACKIVLKYKRQLAAKSVDVTPVEEPNWRIPLRKMDYSRSLMLHEDKLHLRFPFQNQLIEHIRDFQKSSQGEVKWNKNLKVWEVALTEYNLSWVYAWAKTNSFEIESGVEQLMKLITDCELNSYAIELTVSNDRLFIVNAHDSLNDYVEQHLGGWNLDNLLRLVNASSDLGYTINDDLAKAIRISYGHRFYNLATNREVKINPNGIGLEDDFASVLDYADQCQLWPVVVYEPDLSNRMLNRLQSRYADNEITVAGNSKNPEITEQTKYIHTYKPIRNLDTINLVITSAGMVFGGDKQLMIQRAKKIVYCAAEVYNKKTVGRKVADIAS
jgi:hypothetical protein